MRCAPPLRCAPHLEAGPSMHAASLWRRRPTALPTPGPHPTRPCLPPLEQSLAKWLLLWAQAHLLFSIYLPGRPHRAAAKGHGRCEAAAPRQRHRHACRPHHPHSYRGGWQCAGRCQGDLPPFEPGWGPPTDLQRRLADPVFASRSARGTPNPNPNPNPTPTSCSPPALSADPTPTPTPSPGPGLALCQLTQTLTL